MHSSEINKTVCQCAMPVIYPPVTSAMLPWNIVAH
jgi:hypothetical protein